MSPTTLRTIIAGAIAILAVGGGIAFALVAQSQGHSPEPPAWLSLLIGGAATFFYAQSSNLNGSAQAIEHFAAAVTARRATDPMSVTATYVTPLSPPATVQIPGGPPNAPTTPVGT